MDAKKCGVLGLLCGVMLFVAAGCAVADPLITGGAKIGTGRMTTLTADEVQAVTNFVRTQSQVAGQFDSLTDAQAQALIYFLQDNGIDTLQDARYFVDHPDEIVITQRVLDVLTEEAVLDILDRLADADLDDIL